MTSRPIFMAVLLFVYTLSVPVFSTRAQSPTSTGKSNIKSKARNVPLNQGIRTGPTSDSPIVIVGGSLALHSKEPFTADANPRKKKVAKTAYRITTIVMISDDEGQDVYVDACKPGRGMTLTVPYTTLDSMQRMLTISAPPACNNLDLDADETWGAFNPYPDASTTHRLTHQQDVHVGTISLRVHQATGTITCDTGCTILVNYVTP